MLSGLSARRHLSALAVLGGLFILACTVTAEAGITLSGGGYKGVGDPKAHYDLFAYLDPGSILVTNNYFTLNKLFGIKNGANYKIIAPNKKQQWGVAFGTLEPSASHSRRHRLRKVSCHRRDIRLPRNCQDQEYQPRPPSCWASSRSSRRTIPSCRCCQAAPRFNDHLRLQDEGFERVEYPFSFTVVPEPSSFVIATLVGSCVTGLALVREASRGLKLAPGRSLLDLEA